jgi:hypothetical protein
LGRFRRGLKFLGLEIAVLILLDCYSITLFCNDNSFTWL